MSDDPKQNVNPTPAVPDQARHPSHGVPPSGVVYNRGQGHPPSHQPGQQPPSRPPLSFIRQHGVPPAIGSLPPRQPQPGQQYPQQQASQPQHAQPQPQLQYYRPPASPQPVQQPAPPQYYIPNPNQQRPPPPPGYYYPQPPPQGQPTSYPQQPQPMPQPQNPPAGYYYPQPPPPPAPIAPNPLPAPQPLGFIDSEYAARFGPQKPVARAKPQRKFKFFRLPKARRLVTTGPGLSTRIKQVKGQYKKVPKAAWITFCLILIVCAAGGLSMLLIFHKQPPAYINTSLPSTDQQRQRDLNAIQTALHKFYNSNNQQYPIASRLELNGKDDMLTQKLTPLYLAKLPLDSNTATPYIYTSLTGKSFLLTATLSSGQPYQVTE